MLSRATSPRCASLSPCPRSGVAESSTQKAGSAAWIAHMDSCRIIKKNGAWASRPRATYSPSWARRPRSVKNSGRTDVPSVTMQSSDARDAHPPSEIADGTPTPRSPIPSGWYYCSASFLMNFEPRRWWHDSAKNNATPCRSGVPAALSKRRRRRFYGFGILRYERLR